MRNTPKTNTCLRVFILLIIFLGILSCVMFAAIIGWLIGLPGQEIKSPAAWTQQPVNLPTAVIARSAAPEEFVYDHRVLVVSDAGASTSDAIRQMVIPVNQPVELARRIGGLTVTPVFKFEKPYIPSLGEERQFWVLDVDTNEYRQVDAHLAYTSQHLYFWVEKGVEVDQEAMAELCETFDHHIYPTNREIFGSEWSPGVDHDEHLSALYARGLGSAAGVFSSTDSLTTEVEPYSNEAEMFYISADYAPLDSAYTYGVFAHEFQHMIHWNMNRNESAWINEGLSELAIELNGFEKGGFAHYFTIDPDLQLNFWPGNEQGDSIPHYGASYLFMKYLMDRFGVEAIKALARDVTVGLASIDAVFADRHPDLTYGYTAEKIFQDWAIENFQMGAHQPTEDRVYQGYDDFPSIFPTETLRCDSGWQERSVNQFGTDYLSIECSGPYVIEIQGDATVPLLPVNPYSGDFYFWSNYGDSADMTLTKTFDFRGQSGSLTLTFQTWYDVESDYDYLYLLASVDGEKWEILNPTRCTLADPTGSNFGCGYNGKSGGWVTDNVDLSKFAGQQVTLQFEYVTDLAVNGDGFLVDDISIDEIGYFSDFEADDGGWEGKGFVRVSNQLPQNYGVSLLSAATSGENEKLISVGGLSVEREGAPGQYGANSILVLNGLTRVTRQPALYRIRITRR